MLMLMMTMTMTMGLTRLAAAAMMMMGCHSDRMVLMLITIINIAVGGAATMVDTDDDCVYRSVCPRELEVIPNMLYDNPMSKDG